MPDRWRDQAEQLLGLGLSVNQIARRLGIRNGNPIQNWIKTQRTDLLAIARENGRLAKSTITRVR
jgi:transposase-like protein